MPPRVAITGAGGQLGRQLVAAVLARGGEVLAMTHADWDITRAADLDRLAGWRPTIVVNAAAWTDVDGCARDPGRAMEVNGYAAGAVARCAAAAGALAIQVSTNEVFDGTLARPYVEADQPNPVNSYGRSKLAGEELTAAAGGNHLIVRTAWLFGAGGSNFVSKMAAAAQRAAAKGDQLRVVRDEWGNPTPADWLGDQIMELIDRPSRPRIAHLVGQPPASRLEWVRVIVAELADSVQLEPIGREEFVRSSTPPPRAVLASSHGLPYADWVTATRVMVAAGRE